MRKFINSYSLFLCCCLLAAPALAAPAPWYWWTSKVDGARICMQTSPGDGWTQGRAAFRDARCRIPPDSRQ